MKNYKKKRKEIKEKKISKNITTIGFVVDIFTFIYSFFPLYNQCFTFDSLYIWFNWLFPSQVWWEFIILCLPFLLALRLMDAYGFSAERTTTDVTKHLRRTSGGSSSTSRGLGRWLERKRAFV